MTKQAKTNRRRQSETIERIADYTEIPKKDVKAVLEALADEVIIDLQDTRLGQFNFPFLGLKLRRVRKPARKARKGRNPFTGEEMMFKAKPAHIVVKATVLKSLKGLEFPRRF